MPDNRLSVAAIEGLTMPTYAGFVDVEDREFQNVQELASLFR